MQADFRIAGLADVEPLLGFVRDFNAEQGYPCDAVTTRRTLRELCTDPALGRLWLILCGGEAVGYLALTFGFSLEYAGRDAFLDEFFVVPRVRGHGLGRAAVAFALDEAKRLGVHAVHLEVEDRNPNAQRLYRSAGFEGNDRHLLTRRL